VPTTLVSALEAQCAFVLLDGVVSIRKQEHRTNDVRGGTSSFAEAPSIGTENRVIISPSGESTRM